MKGLAKRSGITWNTISALERGQNVYELATLKALAQALDVDLAVFTDAHNMPEGTLGEKLEKARMLRGHTRKEAMAAIGISNHTYMSVILGRRQPSKKTVGKIIEYIKN